MSLKEKACSRPSTGNGKPNLLGSFYFKLFPFGSPKVITLEEAKEAVMPKDISLLTLVDK